MSGTSPYLSTTDIAKRFEVTVDTVYRYVAEEGLPAHRLARRLRFLPDEVDAWVRARTTSASGMPTAPAAPARSADPDWVAAQLAQFTPADLRRAGEVLLSLAGTLDGRTAV
ncbi:helix-turn-helix domain-containing protein [Nocardia sp. NPDC019219]|uniref:helix-turn-helix domain-containing protein n=1 Tax=Nocardia sp. NPDC019219 TaxID=3154590 RepID=UPI0033F16FF7